MTAALAPFIFLAAITTGLTGRAARLHHRDRARELAAYRRTIADLGGRLWFRTWQRDMESAARRRAQADAAGWKAVAHAQFERLIDEKEQARFRVDASGWVVAEAEAVVQDAVEAER